MTPQELQLIELLYDAAADPGEPQLAVLSKRFLELLYEKFGLSNQCRDLPQLVQLEIPMRHVARIASTFDGIDSRRDAYVKALGVGIGHLYDRFGLLDEDVLGLWLSCIRPGQAEQLALAYKEEWCKSPESTKLGGLQHLLIERRLCRLLERGLFEKDEDEPASNSFLDWIGKEVTDRVRETLGSLRSSFFYGTALAWKGLTEESRRRCLGALAGGLLLLCERNRKSDLDPLVLRMIIHWRPWQKPDQVVAAYDSLEGISEFLPAAFMESRLYRALLNARVERLRMPDELVRVGVASIARSATTFLYYNEPERLPSREVLCHWIDEAVEMVFHRSLLAIASAQESLLPPGKRLRGKPRTLKLLPFLQSRSELARQEKHILLGDLPRLLAALGDLDPKVWDDGTVSASVPLLFQGVAYEWNDRGEDDVPPSDLPKIRRLKKTREFLKKIYRKLPDLPRRVVGDALDDEIALLDQRLRLA